MAGTKLAVTIGAAALLLAACSSAGSSGNTSTNTTATHSAAAQAPAAPASSAPAAATHGALSGTWHGQYGGSYQGTFVLHWLESGSKLNGHINLSNPGGALPIHGTVNGGSIQFGTVGSYQITYTGTVAGSSMSGSYKVGSSQGGNWNASKG
jgi:hypothetical protein